MGNRYLAGLISGRRPSGRLEGRRPAVPAKNALSAMVLMAFLAGGAWGQTVKIESPVMKPGSCMPKRFTAAGKNVSPPLVWSAVPDSAREIALVFETVDGRQVHWVAYRIPAGIPGLPEGLPAEEVVANFKKLDGIIQGRTSFSGRGPGYHGPAPSQGKGQQFRFTLYAVGARLGLLPGLDRDSLLYLIKGHIVGKGELIVTGRK